MHRSGYRGFEDMVPLTLSTLDAHGLLDRTHDAAWIMSTTGELLDWTPGAERLFGMPLNEITRNGVYFAQIHQGHGDDDEFVELSSDRLLSASFTRGEVAAWLPDGRRIVINCRREMLADERGAQIALLITADDITHRFNASEGLRRSEVRYRNIFQTTGVGIWEVDFSPVKRLIDSIYATGVTDLRSYVQRHPEFARQAMKLSQCKDVNGAALRIFEARSKEELLGPTDKVWPPESEADFLASVFAARLGKPSSETETTLLTVNQRPIHVLLSTAFPSESASREHIFVTVTDITARTRAREAHRRLEAKFAEASRLSSLGQLAAYIAHEVTQPIAGMLASAQAGALFLARDEPDIETAILSLEKVADEAKRTAAIVQGIRALAKSERLQPARSDLHSLITESISLLAYDIRTSKVQVITDYADKAISIEADRVQIQQVVNNLLMNAIQALSGSEDGKRVIRVSARQDETGIRVTIDDNGPGISHDIGPDIFREFATNRESGLGLGLSLCASIMERHNGRIWLEPKAEAGARFIFSLPAPPAERAAGAIRIRHASVG